MNGVDKALNLVAGRPGQVTAMERDGAAELWSHRKMASVLVRRGVRTWR